MNQLSATTTGSTSESLSFLVSNVTGSQEIKVEYTPGLSARSVTDSIAHRFSLPSDVAWQLRDDGSSAYLDEDRSIGDQVVQDAHLTVTPKTHLGGGLVSSV